MNTQNRGLVCLSVLGFLASAANANILANPGFEGATGYGAAGWITFGNGYTEAAAPPAIVPLSGNGIAKMFGGFTGGFSVSGMFQEFPTAPGEMWTMSVASRHFSGDAMIGAGAPASNWAVMKLAFFDASNVELGFAAVEATILNGSFATDVWHINAPIAGAAPAGAVKVQTFLLYLAPGNDGGAAQFDDAVVTPAPGAAMVLGLAGVFASRRRR
jgi:hypothetical protein